MSDDTEKITLELDASFAVYLASSLYAIHDVLDERVSTDATPASKSRVAALEVMCDQLSRALYDQLDREKIDKTIGQLQKRHKK